MQKFYFSYVLFFFLFFNRLKKMIFLKDIKILLLPIFYNIFFMNNVSSSTVESNYASLKNKKFKDLDPRNIYISFETVFTKYECFSACNKDERCVLLFFNSNKCRLFKFIPTRNIIDSKSTFLYKKLNNRYFILFLFYFF